MKQIACEMCGSTDLMKQDGVFVCQSCGMKYSMEEARKMMVEIEGAVKIDSSEELANLYVLARRARDAKNSTEALNYYNQILVKDPMNWEPAFYSLVYNSMRCTISNLAASCDTITRGIPSIIKLVNDTVEDREEQRRIYNEMANKINWAAVVFFSNAKENFEYNLKKREAVFVSAIVLVCKFADLLNKTFPEGEFIDAEIICDKQGVLLYSILMKNFPDAVSEKVKRLFLSRAQYIKRNDSNYVIPDIPGVAEDA